MNSYQAEKMARQHGDELRALSARSGHARQAQRHRRPGEALPYDGYPYRIRRAAGWALVSLGLRLAYAAGDD